MKPPPAAPAFAAAVAAVGLLSAPSSESSSLQQADVHWFAFSSSRSPVRDALADDDGAAARRAGRVTRHDASRDVAPARGFGGFGGIALARVGCVLLPRKCQENGYCATDREAESEFCSERAYIRTPRGTLNPPWHAIWPLGRAARPPFESQDSGGDWV